MSDRTGYPGRGPSRSGGRGRSGRGGRHGRSHGRPFNSSDRILVLQMWSSLNTGGKSQMAELINGLLGVIPSVEEITTPDESRGTPTVVVKPKPTQKSKVWDRDILKDVPAIRAFAAKTSSARAQDTETSKCLSISTGVVHRGIVQGVSHEDILAALIEHWGDAVQMSYLYGTAGPSLDGDGDANMSVAESRSGKPAARPSAGAPMETSKASAASGRSEVTLKANINSQSTALVSSVAAASTASVLPKAANEKTQKSWGSSSSDSSGAQNSGVPDGTSGRSTSVELSVPRATLGSSLLVPHELSYASEDASRANKRRTNNSGRKRKVSKKDS